MPPVLFGGVVAFLVTRGGLQPAGNPVVHFALVGVGLVLMLAGDGHRLPHSGAGVRGHPGHLLEADLPPRRGRVGDDGGRRHS